MTATQVPVQQSDEAILLDALHGTGPVGERLKKEFLKNRNKAEYKIEVQFMSARSSKLEAMNLAVVMAWESGKRFHGGGDQRMVFCGYWPGQGFHGEDACRKPIKDENFAAYHLVCPHCKREQFLDAQGKQRHIQYLAGQKKDTSSIARLPIANPNFMMKLSTRKMARFIHGIWVDLEGNADVYVKFHATDIRCMDVPEVKKGDHYDKARRDRTEKKENRGLLIYPMANIIKDVVAGASVEDRIFAMLRA